MVASYALHPQRLSVLSGFPAVLEPEVEAPYLVSGLHIFK